VTLVPILAGNLDIMVEVPLFSSVLPENIVFTGCDTPLSGKSTL
jgi:hypothetical protein